MSDPLLFALWLIPLAAVAALGGLFLLNRHWQRKAEQELKTLRLALRRARNDQREIERKAQSYSGRDPEPYRSAFSGLSDKLAFIRRKLEEVERQAVELNQRSASLRFNRWRALLSAAYQWQRLCRDAILARRLLDQLQAQLALAAEMELDLERLPWQTALEVRRLRDQSVQASQALASLRDRGLHGETFEAALRSERQLQTSLAQVDSRFLDAGEVELIEQASKDDVALAHQVVQASLPRLDELLAQAHLWQTGSESTEGEIHLLRTALDELAQTLENLPPALVVKEERAAQRQMEEVARSLQATLERMEVESIPLISQEAGRLRQAAQENSQQVRHARRELAALETLLAELADDFRVLPMELAELTARDLHPVEWDVSLTELAQLNRQFNAFGNARQERTPLQAQQDFKSAAELRTGQKELARHIQEIRTAHRELASLLESPEYRAMPQWVRASRSLIDRASEYASENWGSGVDVPALTAEISALAREIERLVADDPAEPVSERELAERLEQTRGLGERYSSLSRKVESLHQRMQEIQQSKAQAQEGLENLHKTLNQARLIVQSNPFLAGIALSEVERMERSAAELGEALEQNQRGNVEKKARQVAAALGRFETAVGRWLDQMRKENQAMHRDLERALAELDSIARLEDGSLGEARRLLSAGLPQGASPTRQTAGAAPADTVFELKRHSDHWQQARAALNALENIQPLADIYHEAAHQRKQTLALAAEIERGLQKRTWPPVSTSLERERQDLQSLEAEWESLKQRSGKAISLVSVYASLSSRYQNLGERLHQGVERRAQEMGQIQDLEEQIVALAEPWESLLAQHRDNPVASREIRGLLADLDDEMEDIEKGYLRGELDYDEVVKQMRNLQRRIRYYQVALDDETAMDSSGRLIRRRQSERGGF